MDCPITERRMGLRVTQKDLKKFRRKLLHKKPKGLISIKLDTHEFDEQMVYIPKKLVQVPETLESLNR